MIVVCFLLGVVIVLLLPLVWLALRNEKRVKDRAYEYAAGGRALGFGRKKLGA